MRLVKNVGKSLLLGAASRVSIVRSAASYVCHNTEALNPRRDDHKHLRERFIANGQSSRFDSATRSELADRFEEVDRSVRIASTPTDALVLAEILLSLPCEGDIVECGCFAGGSSAKLSLVASLLGKRLLVCDSFEGLPSGDDYDKRDYHLRRSTNWRGNWTPGSYAITLDDVKANVERYGDVSVCSFVKGWFSDTLTDENLPAAISMAFVDVDLPSSARDCLVALWPRLSEQGVFVSHDASFIKVVQTICDGRLWRESLDSYPPIFFGAGYGIYDSSPNLGYFVKGDSLSPEYLKSLTIYK